jgi:SAM-dependent methyltransferase
MKGTLAVLAVVLLLGSALVWFGDSALGAGPARSVPAAAVGSTSPQGAEQQASAQGAANPRLYPPVDLGLLEGPDRDAWQKPDRVMDSLGIGEASVVGDLGAGGGWFTIRLARRVGPNGVVFAEDIQLQMIEAIVRRVKREGLRNVNTVLGTANNPGLPPRSLDAILIVEVSNEMEDRVALLTNAARALKPNGRIGIIDYNKEGLGPGPPLDERVDPDTIIRDARAAGLRLLRRETFLPYQFFLILGLRE